MRKYGLPFTPNFGAILYKPLVLISVGILGLFLLNRQDARVFESFFTDSFAMGIYQSLSVLLIGNLVLRFHRVNLLTKWVGILFAPQPNKSLGFLFSSLCAFTWLLQGFAEGGLDSIALSAIAFSFATGTALTVFIYELVGPKTRDFHVTYDLQDDRQEAFIAVVISSVFLGTTFSFLSPAQSLNATNGVIFFPLYLAITGLIVTFFSAVLVGEKPKNERYWFTISLVSVIFMMTFATELIITLLPNQWSFNGVEYQPSDLLVVVQLGLFAGLCAGISVKFYDFVANWYVQFVLKQSSKRILLNLSLRFLINVIYPVLPSILVAASLLLSYQVGGLYGASLSFLGMLSNVGMSLVIKANKLQEQEIPSWQKQKLALLSPDFQNVAGELARRAFSKFRKSV